jgi:hypothetical protein
LANQEVRLHLQWVRHLVCQCLRESHNIVVQVAAIRIQDAELRCGCLHNPWVCVTNVAHIVDTIEILPVILVIQILTGT